MIKFKKLTQIIFAYLLIIVSSVKKEAVWRWTVVDTGDIDGMMGSEGDGTSIDFEEPFIVKYVISL